MILIFSHDDKLFNSAKWKSNLFFLIISFEELIQWITVMVLGSLAVVINQLLIYANILSSPPVNSMVSYIGGKICLEILQKLLLVSYFQLIPVSWACSPYYRQEDPRYYWYFSSTCFALEYILTQSKESAMVSIIVSGWFTWNPSRLDQYYKTTHILYFIFQLLY